jgi:hypothetical protein
MEMPNVANLVKILSVETPSSIIRRLIILETIENWKGTTKNVITAQSVSVFKALEGNDMKEEIATSTGQILEVEIQYPI